MQIHSDFQLYLDRPVRGVSHLIPWPVQLLDFVVARPLTFLQISYLHILLDIFIDAVKKGHFIAPFNQLNLVD